MNVEDGADVTDTTNVTAAGALMDSELTDLAGIKALDTSTLAPLASPTFTGTVTLPTGLTGVIRADSGVVSVDTDVTDLVDNLAVSQLADGTDGELITWSATGAPTTVAAGTSGHVLTSNGAGAAPTFQAAGGGGAWTLKEYSTATAQSITSGTLDLATDNNHYMIIVDMNFGGTSDRVKMRAQLNSITTADTYSTVGNGHSIDFSAGSGTARTLVNKAAQWQFTGVGADMGHLVMHVHLSENPSAAARVVGSYQYSGNFEDISQEDHTNMNGAFQQNSQTNMTSIKFFHDGAQNKDWRMWIFYPATS